MLDSVLGCGYGSEVDGRWSCRSRGIVDPVASFAVLGKDDLRAAVLLVVRMPLCLMFGSWHMWHLKMMLLIFQLIELERLSAADPVMFGLRLLIVLAQAKVITSWDEDYNLL